jgi:hypothetical protein
VIERGIDTGVLQQECPSAEPVHLRRSAFSKWRIARRSPRAVTGELAFCFPRARAACSGPPRHRVHSAARAPRVLLNRSDVRPSAWPCLDLDVPLLRTTRCLETELCAVAGRGRAEDDRSAMECSVNFNSIVSLDAEKADKLTFRMRWQIATP